MAIAHYLHEVDDPTMKFKCINDAEQKTYALIFEEGDEVTDGLKDTPEVILLESPGCLAR